MWRCYEKQAYHGIWVQMFAFHIVSLPPARTHWDFKLQRFQQRPLSHAEMLLSDSENKELEFLTS